MSTHNMFSLRITKNIMWIPSLKLCWGWSGDAKVSCIVRLRGIQLILAYSWARPAILVAGNGRGGMFLFLLFLHFHSCHSFFPVPVSVISSTISSISSTFLS